MVGLTNILAGLFLKSTLFFMYCLVFGLILTLFMSSFKVSRRRWLLVSDEEKKVCVAYSQNSRIKVFYFLSKFSYSNLDSLEQNNHLNCF